MWFTLIYRRDPTSQFILYNLRQFPSPTVPERTSAAAVTPVYNTEMCNKKQLRAVWSVKHIIWD